MSVRERTPLRWGSVGSVASGAAELMPNVEPEIGGPGDEHEDPAHPPASFVARWVWPAAIGVVALVTRVWGLNRVGFNSDEVVYSTQASVLAGDNAIARLFPLFRAHPLLFQTIVSGAYRVGFTDSVARALSVAFGLGTVALGYVLGRELYTRTVGLVTASLLAVMPYLVVVNRQVLLDGPMTFFATLTLLLLARYAISRKAVWLYAASAVLGLTFLTKETGIIFAVAVYAFVALTPELRVKVRDVVISLAILFVTMLPFPLSVLTSNRSQSGEQYFVWQLLRHPNHAMGFYVENVPQAIGVLVIGAVVVALWVLRRRRSWRETLLLAWVLVPIVFFGLWPVKGFQYLLPISVPIAVLAARGLARLPIAGQVRIAGREVPARLVTGAIVVVLTLSLLVPTWQRITTSSSRALLAGAGGTPGGRETGRWIGEHVPEGAQILTLGPSMANIVQYYGRRKTYGLSVSANPLHRNPVYEAVANPDRIVRDGDLHYLVWDAYSAHRSPTFSDRLRRLAAKYHGLVVHREYAGTARPVVVVYEVRPR